MPNCDVCGEKFYYATQTDPPEDCMCGARWHGDNLTAKAWLARIIFKYFRSGRWAPEWLFNFAVRMAQS